MAYQVLYRKYRPSKFEDVIGQDPIVETIKNSIMEERISHAYLFCGPRGVGKTSLAKIIAKTVNCNNLKDGEPCEECSSCVQIQTGKTPDVIEIDAASNNGVDEIRELRNKVVLVPTSCKYKIYIIDEVHMLSTGAFNALLKTLEEPPAHIIFILATTEVHKIPATVISRCQRFDLKAISNEDIIKGIKLIANKEKIKISDEAIYEITKISNGGLRDSLGILDQAFAYKNKDIQIDDIYNINGTISLNEMEELLKNVFINDAKAIYAKLDKYRNDGKNFQKIMEYLLDYVVKSIRNVITKRKQNDFSEIADYDKLYRLSKDLLKALSEVKEVNNAHIILEITLINYINFDEIHKVKENIGKEEIKAVVKNEKPSEDIKLTNEEKKLEDTKPVKEEKLDNKMEDSIEKLKKIRINNTLATADKNILIKIKKDWNKLFEYTTNPNYSLIVGRLLDAEIKAAGSEYLIVSYPNKAMADIFNNTLEDIEKVILDIFNEERKLIAITNKEWDISKNEYIKLLKNNEKPSLVKEDIVIEKPVLENEEKEGNKELIELLGTEFNSIIEFK